MCNIYVEININKIYNSIYIIIHIAITVNMQLITFKLKKDYKTLSQAFL